MRSGLLTGLPRSFDTEEGITGAEAAVMLQNALDLTARSDAAQPVSAGAEAAPEWAASALQVLGDYGIALEAENVLKRGDAAQVMYQVSLLAPDAPGTIALRLTQ